MKKLITLLIIILMLGTLANAQNYQARYKIKIPDSSVVIKNIKCLCDSTVVPAGFTKKNQYTLDSAGVTITATKTEVTKKKEIYRSNKTIQTNFTNLGGWATLTSDEKDKSKIKKRQRDIGSDGKLSAWKDVTYLDDKDTTVYLQKLDSAEYQSAKNKKWFDAVNTQIIVYTDNSKSNIAYYLIDKYDRDVDYTIKLKNREFISFPYTSFDFGPMTIPFKQRFGYKKGTVTVDPQIQADLNVGVFGGYTLGRYRKRYESGTPGELKDLSNLSFTFGGFLNISTAALDSAATTAGKLPFAKDKTATIGVVSFGTGVLTTFYNFQIGLFAGMDKGVGTNAQNWNFNNKPWVGIGIGYDLKKLFFK
jgi:hypothetical protein